MRRFCLPLVFIFSIVGLAHSQTQPPTDISITNLKAGGERIIFVTNSETDLDLSQINWLKAHGFDVTVWWPSNGVENVTWDEIRILDRASLVVLGRGPMSFEFALLTDILDQVQTPMICSHPYAVRGSRMNWFKSLDVHHFVGDTSAGVVSLFVNDPSDPMFEEVELGYESTLEYSDWAETFLVQNDTVQTNAQIVAHLDSLIAIARFEPHVSYHNETEQAPASYRTFFGFGNRIARFEGDESFYYFPLTDMARQVYLNEINRLLGMTFKVKENLPIASPIGLLKVKDDSTDDSHTFTLVSGVGDADKFKIVSDTLFTNVVFDYETYHSAYYDVSDYDTDYNTDSKADSVTIGTLICPIRVTNSMGESFEEHLIIEIEDVNEPPTKSYLTHSSIDENITSGRIGLLETSDDDLEDFFSYSLVDGEGDNDNHLFQIDARKLTNMVAFDFEKKSEYSIRVRATDSGGLMHDEVFKINVLNVNDIRIELTAEESLCAGEGSTGSITSTVYDTNGPVSYSWVGPDGYISDLKDIDRLSPGAYFLTVSDDFHSLSQSVHVTKKPTFNGASICYVSADEEETDWNRVYLNYQDPVNVDKFQILKEGSSAETYDVIGQLEPGEQSFLDTTSNASGSFSYRVRALDQCGDFSSESDYHTSIFLRSSVEYDGTVNLYWNPYEGVEYMSYSLYRSLNEEDFIKLDDIAYSQTSYTDTSADVQDNYYTYYLAIAFSSCEPGDGQSLIKSNRISVSAESILAIDGDSYTFDIFPNPANNQLNIFLGNGVNRDGRLFLSDVKGVVLFETLANDFKGHIDISNLAPGVYLVGLSTSSSISTVKFIKEK